MKFSGGRAIFIFLLSGILTAIFTVSCIPEKQYHVLTFFFDGVPKPEIKQEQPSFNNTGDSTVEVKKEIKPEYFIHKPYEEEKCKSCHAEGFSNALIKPLPDLCYNCHEDFNSEYKTLHGPVASGNCTMCHNQHMSKNEKLLERTGQQLCLYCHESGQVLKNKMHEHIENKNCTECHSPHGGDNKGMLVSGSCYNCHDNFNSRYKFMHGPAASENCTACHDTHSSKSKNILLRDSQQLCLFCHNSTQVFNNAAHKKSKKNNCTECHNPHGGEDNYFLQALIKEGNHSKNDSIMDKSKNNPEIDSTINK